MKQDSEILTLARETMQSEGEALIRSARLLGDSFVKMVELIHSRHGRLIVTGVGKSAHVAQKIVATLNSTGTPALFMHAVEALHGDLGMIQPDDLVLCLSKSGNTQEIKNLIPLIKTLNVPILAMVSDPGSYLESQSDFTVRLEIGREACPHNLVPTTSTTLQLAFGDALALSLLKITGFSPDDFARLHPGGSLGKQLNLRVSDLYTHNLKPSIKESDSIQKVILEISSKRLGATAVFDAKGALSGVITDGDLRRMMEKYPHTDNLNAAMIMSRQPKIIAPDELAVNALHVMRENSITQLLVVENNHYLGVIHIHDILQEGIV